MQYTSCKHFWQSWKIHCLPVLYFFTIIKWKNMESSKKRVPPVRHTDTITSDSLRLFQEAHKRLFWKSFPRDTTTPVTYDQKQKRVPSVRYTGTITRESPGTLQGARRRLLRKGTQLLPTRMIIFGGPNSHLRYSPHNLSPSKMFAGKWI